MLCAGGVTFGAAVACGCTQAGAAGATGDACLASEITGALAVVDWGCAAGFATEFTGALLQLTGGGVVLGCPFPEAKPFAEKAIAAMTIVVVRKALLITSPCTLG